MSGFTTITVLDVHIGRTGVVPMACVELGIDVPTAWYPPTNSWAAGSNAVPVAVITVPPDEGPDGGCTSTSVSQGARRTNPYSPPTNGIRVAPTPTIVPPRTP